MRTHGELRAVRVWGWIGVALLAVVGTFAVVVEVADGPLDPGHPRESVCAQADALRSARLLDKARETYESAGTDGEKCPKLKGLEATEAKAEEHFGTAGVYAAASKVAAEKSEPAGARESSRRAIDEYAAGLERDPLDNAANLALTMELKKELVQPAAQCKTATTLTDAGLLSLAGVALANGLAENAKQCESAPAALSAQREAASERLREARELDGRKARRAYAEALRTNANLAAAKTELEDSLDSESRLDRVGGWLDGALDTLEKALAWIIPLAIGLFALALLAWMGVRESAAHWSWARTLFEGLGKNLGLTFFYNAAVPDVKIEPFGGKGGSDLEGADFSTLLEAEIAKPGGESDFVFDGVSKGVEPDDKDSVSVVDLLTEVPATKLLGNALQTVSKLFRRRTVLLTGRLTPSADKGAGVYLSVEGNDEDLNESTTLWQQAYDPNPGGSGAVRWLRLVPAAAAWARWHLAEAQDPTQQLEIGRWKADALFQSARAWELEEDQARAEALYTEALESSPALLPAAHNLSVIELRKKDYAGARERVEKLRSTLETGAGSLTPAKMTKQWPTLDTGSLYTLTLALAYPEIDDEADPEDGNLGAAVEKGRLLVATLARQLEPPPRGKKPEAAIREQLELAEPAAVVVLAGLAVRRENQRDKETAIQYALADGAGVDKVTRSKLRDDIDGMKPWMLIHGYAEEQPNLARRTHYNLACYYTTLSEFGDCEQKAKCRERALKSLKAALVGGYLVEWADEDPSLRPLKKACGQKFAEILKSHTVEPHPEKKPAADGEGEKTSEDEHKSLPEQLKQLGKSLQDMLGQ